jgi:two-component system response regulator YesN
MMAEVYESTGGGVIPFAIDRTTIGWLLYAADGHFHAPEEALEALRSVYQHIVRYFPFDFAFYMGSFVPLEQVGLEAEKLLHAKQDNVLLKSGVFSAEKSKDAPPPAAGADPVQVRRWTDLLSEGDGQTLRKEIFQYLDDLCDAGQLNHQFLHNFRLQFQQVVLNVLWFQGLDSQALLPLLRQGERAQSVPEIRAMVDEVVKQFGQAEALRDEKEPVRRAEKYVEEHLYEPFNVSDVADALFMNPDYLSRLFKSKHGISLKEYIVREKMHAAQTLLQTTALPVSIIASKLGYDNYSYFSQAYRKAMGISPTDERKMRS